MGGNNKLTPWRTAMVCEEALAIISWSWSLAFVLVCSHLSCCYHSCWLWRCYYDQDLDQLPIVAHSEAMNHWAGTRGSEKMKLCWQCLDLPQSCAVLWRPGCFWWHHPVALRSLPLPVFNCYYGKLRIRRCPVTFLAEVGFAVSVYKRVAKPAAQLGSIDASILQGFFLMLVLPMLTCSLNLIAVEKCLTAKRTMLCVGGRRKGGGAGKGVDLCSDDCTALVLLCPLHHKLSTLSLLSSNLFCFNCSCELTTKCKVGNRYIIQCNVEVGSSLKQDSPNFSTNNLFQLPNKNKNGWLQWLVVVMLHEQRWLSCFTISAWAMINCIVFAD